MTAKVTFEQNPFGRACYFRLTRAERRTLGPSAMLSLARGLIKLFNADVYLVSPTGDLLLMAARDIKYIPGNKYNY